MSCSQRLIAGKNYRRVAKKEDLVQGGTIIRTEVGEYQGPGSWPRISICEEIVLLQHQDSRGFYAEINKVSTSDNLFIRYEELINVIKSDGITTSYWIEEE